jgi:sensor histidine kinase YesM
MIHPITGNRSRFFIWWLIWLIFGLGQSLLLLLTSDAGPSGSFIDGFLSAIIYGLLAIAIWFPTIQLNNERTQWTLIAANHIVICALTLLVWLFSVKWITSSIIDYGEQYIRFWNDSVFYRVAAGAFIYALVILTYYLMVSMDNIAKKNMREANLENMLRETELMMLRSQINPHFLFNSLNSISSLTITDSARAREMVIKLSDFMRYALSRKEDKTVSLKTELENLRLYLEIEKVRFGDKLILKEQFDKTSLSVNVPNMILQPLYENAIKHGVYESIDKVIINLDVKRSNGGIRIKIANNYDPEAIPVRGTGTGLINVRRRLELYYGARGHLITEKENKRFIAELYIPEQTDIKS